MTEETIDTQDLNLREFARGFIKFSIKADDTEENQAVHDAFKEYCKVETDNNYTQGIRKLLEYYQGDFKLEMIYEKMQSIEMALDALKASVVEQNNKPKEADDESTAF